MITAIILTLNEERHLPDCLASLRWADEIVVFDSFSTDSTTDIARQFGARLIQHRFENYAAQRNAALDAAQADWIFFVDADERATSALAEEIRAIVTPAESNVSRPFDTLRAGRGTELETLESAAVGWWVPRHNYIFGKLTLRAGWYPDYQLRLLRRGRVRYDPNRHVHELALLDGGEGRLQNPLIHLNYETVPEFIAKQYQYTQYDAGILHTQGIRARPQNFVLQPLRQFYWRFVALGGWRDGWHGLRLSALMAYFQFVLYQKLAEISAKPDLR